MDTLPQPDYPVHKITAAIEASAFFYNEEYKGNFSTGSTLTGIRLQPSLFINIDSSTMLKTGIWIQQMAQRSDKMLILPFLRLDRKLSSHWQLVMGNLYGTSHHQLPEELYDYSRYYRDPLEYGIQFIADYPRWTADVWVDWRTFIYAGDNFQEVFDVGINTSFHFTERQGGLSLPVKALITHRGGEIDISDLPVLTSLSGTLGLDYLDSGAGAYQLGAALLFYRGLDYPQQGLNALPWDNGMGIKLYTAYNRGHWKLGLQYYALDNFIALLGNNELMNYALSSGFTDEQRSILVPSIMYRLNRSGKSNLFFMTRGYYDLNEHNFSFNAGLSIGVQSLFKLL